MRPRDLMRSMSEGAGKELPDVLVGARRDDEPRDRLLRVVGHCCLFAWVLGVVMLAFVFLTFSLTEGRQEGREREWEQHRLEMERLIEANSD